MKEKTRQETKTREMIDEKPLYFNVDAVLFMKQKPRRKKKKETKTRNHKKAKKKDKKEGRKRTTRER